MTSGAVVARAAESLTSERLLDFLARQRWFAAKSARPSDARVAECIVMPWGDGRFAIALVDVRVGAANRRLQVPIAAMPPDPTLDERIVIARVDGLVVIDAVHAAEFRRGLAAALGRGAHADTPVDAHGTAWRARAVGGAAATLVRGDGRVGSAEQSNTSIVYGETAIVKLFRTLVPGIQPDVEMSEFLSVRAHFADTPALLGAFELERGGERTIAGMAQAFLPGSTDAWQYALERAAPYFAAPIDQDPVNAVADDARRLGAVTRALHEALASDDDDPAFAPEPATPEDLDRWAQRTQHSIRESLALLESQLAVPGFPPERVAEARALVRRRDHYLGWVDEIADTMGDDLGMRTRVHGDYHLGQVLRAASGSFSIIDFEGEPSRPLSDRREKTSPVRDVAGMLRSFAYAAASAAMAVDGRAIDARTRELRTARWERDVRAAFLDGYLAPTDDEGAEILPGAEVHIRQLIRLFETEKAFYELAYELNNRPAWVWIPMRGVAKLFTR